ncbi:MAG: hypothetical protein RIC19_00860 [Phaeodactylibacter sp.]
MQDLLEKFQSLGRYKEQRSAQTTSGTGAPGLDGNAEAGGELHPG